MMNEKFDKVVSKVGDLLDTWITEFETAPLRTTAKVLLILYVIKWARRNLL